MTPGDTKFSHITVHADDDDEFVIQAGAPALNDDTPASVDPAVQDVAAPVAAPEYEQADEPSVANQATVEAHPADSQDGYRPTTVEDLKGEPMSTTQKVVIAAAVVLIVGFVVFNVFMR